MKRMGGDQRHASCRPGALLCAALSAMIALAPASASTADLSKEQQLVDDALKTWKNFAASPGLSRELRDWLRMAKGVFILPQIIRGAAVFGAAGGRGVLLVQDATTDEWSGPAFYWVHALSFGLQAGADVLEVIVVVTNERGLEHFYQSHFKIGMDTQLAAGPVGGGMTVAGLKADLFAYARAKGVFAGLAVDGGRISVSDKFNQSYYGHPVKPTEILVQKSVTNPHAQDLRNAVTGRMR